MVLETMPRRPGERFLKNKQQKAKKEQDRAYNRQRGSVSRLGYDRRWEKVRAAKLLDSPLCEVCEAEGRLTPAEEVHHIRPISDGGDIYLSDNLMSICHSCHMKIHAKDKKSIDV